MLFTLDSYFHLNFKFSSHQFHIYVFLIHSYCHVRYPVPGGEGRNVWMEKGWEGRRALVVVEEGLESSEEAPLRPSSLDPSSGNFLEFLLINSSSSSSSSSSLSSSSSSHVCMHMHTYMCQDMWQVLGTCMHACICMHACM